MLIYLTPRIIRYGSRVKWNNPGKRVAPLLTPQCSSYWKESLRVAFDYGQPTYYIRDTHSRRPRAISLVSVFLRCDVAGVGRKMPKSQARSRKWTVKETSETTWMDLHLYYAQCWGQECNTVGNLNKRRKSTVNPTDFGETDLCFLGVNSTRSHWWHAPDRTALVSHIKPCKLKRIIAIYLKISKQSYSQLRDIKFFMRRHTYN